MADVIDENSLSVFASCTCSSVTPEPPVSAVNAAQTKLEQDRELVDRFVYPQVRVWVYR